MPRTKAMTLHKETAWAVKLTWRRKDTVPYFVVHPDGKGPRTYPDKSAARAEARSINSEPQTYYGIKGRRASAVPIELRELAPAKPARRKGK